MENDFKYKINSIEKTFNIIEVLAKNKTEMSMVDIARELDIQSSLAYRVLNTLKSIGYVSQNSENKKYYLSYSFLKLTKNIVKRNDIVEKYIDSIKIFYNKYSFHSNITGFTRNQVILVKDFSPIHFFSTKVEAGSVVPLHCSAAGKIFLATRTPEEVDEILHYKLRNYTAFTKTTREEIFEDIKFYHENAYSKSVDEYHDGFTTIGFPIISKYGKAVGSVNFSCESSNKELMLNPNTINEIQNTISDIRV